MPVGVRHRDADGRCEPEPARNDEKKRRMLNAVAPALYHDAWVLVLRTLDLLGAEVRVTIHYFASVLRVELQNSKHAAIMLVSRELKEAYREACGTLFCRHFFVDPEKGYQPLPDELLKADYYKGIAATGMVAIDAVGVQFQQKIVYASEESTTARFPKQDFELPELKKEHRIWLLEGGNGGRLTVRSLFTNFNRRGCNLVPNPHTFGRLLRFLQRAEIAPSVVVNYRQGRSEDGKVSVFGSQGPLFPVILGMGGTGHEGSENRVPVSLVGNPDNSNGEDGLEVWCYTEDMFKGVIAVEEHLWQKTMLERTRHPNSCLLHGGPTRIGHITEADVTAAMRRATEGLPIVPVTNVPVDIWKVGRILHGNLYTLDWLESPPDPSQSSQRDLLRMLMHCATEAYFSIRPSDDCSQDHALRGYDNGGGTSFIEFLKRKQLFSISSHLQRSAVIFTESAFEEPFATLKELLRHRTIDKFKKHHVRLRDFALVFLKDAVPDASKIYNFVANILQKGCHSGLDSALRETDGAQMIFSLCFPYDPSQQQPDLHEFLPRQFWWNRIAFTEITSVELSVCEYRLDGMDVKRFTRYAVRFGRRGYPAEDFDDEGMV